MMGKHHEFNLPPPQRESVASKLINGILGTKSKVAIQNEAIAAAQEALKTGQQVNIKSAATNRAYKKLCAQHGGKALPVAETDEGTVVQIRNSDGSTNTITYVNGVPVSNIQTG